ncbi:TetR/AcrR family transcriptional regulator [Streptomyces sp. NPDC002004]
MTGTVHGNPGPAPSPPQARRRAPGMSPGQRREMIVAATLPLLAEYGAAVTTSRIARAAGIGEATVFRAFADKDELLAACVAEAVSPEHVLRELACIPPDQSLSARLTDAAEAMHAHIARMGAVLGSLAATRPRMDFPRERPAPGTGEEPPGSREESLRLVREALAELIAPDRDRLRLEPDRLAAVFLGMLFTRLQDPADGSGAQPSAEELVDVLLNGAVETTGGGG